VKIEVTCPDCSDVGNPEKVIRFFAPIAGHGVNVARCRAGHAVNFTIQTPFFWLLFLRGLTDAARLDFRCSVLNSSRGP